MKKTGLIRVLRILLVAALTLSLFSCGEHDLPSLTGAHGVTIEGGGFKEGSALVVDRINIEESNGGIALAAIRNESYDKDGRVYIFNIYVLYGNERVQPTGRIKVTLPLPEIDVERLVLFRVNKDCTADELTVTLSDGAISFETETLFHFVIAEKA